MDERASRDPRALSPRKKASGDPSQTGEGEACVVSNRRCGQNPRKEGREVFR